MKSKRFNEAFLLMDLSATDSVKQQTSTKVNINYETNTYIKYEID